MVPDAASKTGDFVDCEAHVESRNGPRSWLVGLAPGGDRALLRTATESPGFTIGDRIRLLSLAFARDADTSQMTLTMTQFSEAYPVES